MHIFHLRAKKELKGTAAMRLGLVVADSLFDAIFSYRKVSM
jgi:hypothetical protein